VKFFQKKQEQKLAVPIASKMGHSANGVKMRDTKYIPYLCKWRQIYSG